MCMRALTDKETFIKDSDVYKADAMWDRCVLESDVKSEH